jgi:hypothetical protein
MQFKPVIFVIISLSLVQLAITSGLQQQTAMGRPNFPDTTWGYLCGLLWDEIRKAEDNWIRTGDNKYLDAVHDLLEIYKKGCAEKFGEYLPGIDPDLRDNLLNDTNVPPTAGEILDSDDTSPNDTKFPPIGGMDLLEKSMKNTENNTDGTNVPEDDGDTKKR